jgi:hypothetical protein
VYRASLHHIHSRDAKNFLKSVLDREEMEHTDSTIELHKKVYVTLHSRFISSRRTKKRQGNDSHLLQFLTVSRKFFL